ncbi:hypothetical protein OKA06_14455 [Novosphingobium sp. MW5]|nr:hypothetical protein [Novosphingobium sp. MW5]
MLTGDVLIVEDMMIIAMEAEEQLRDAGAEICHLSTSVADALELLSNKSITFALLDVNLGLEVSEPIAAVLKERGIPFVVASGYGEKSIGHPALSSAPLLTKPYTPAQLRGAIERALRTH